MVNLVRICKDCPEIDLTPLFTGCPSSYNVHQGTAKFVTPTVAVASYSGSKMAESLTCRKEYGGWERTDLPNQQVLQMFKSIYIYIIGSVIGINQVFWVGHWYWLILQSFTPQLQSAALWVLNALHAEPERLLGLTRASGTLGSIHVDSCGFSACRSHILSPSHILPWSPWRKKPGSRLEISMPKFVGTRQLLWGHPSSHHPKNRSSRQRSPWQRAHRSGSALLMKLQPARDAPG